MVTSRWAVLHRDRRAAAAVEFIVVFIPVILLFLVIIELTRFGIAGLMLQRSAGIAVRACAVIKDQPAHCDIRDGTAVKDEDATIKLAAREALRPLSDKTTLTLASAVCQTTVNGSGGSGAPQNTLESGTDRVDVVATYHCAVPLARDLVCPGGTRSMTASAKHAHQGARFDCLYAANIAFAWPPFPSFEFVTDLLYGPP
jgi:hypothetical protein